VSEFLNVIRAAYTPTPDVQELAGTLDIRAWLLPHLNKLKGVTLPHHFLFSKDPSAACGSSVVCQEFSNTRSLPKQELLKSMPSEKPVLRGGRQLFHRSQEAGGSSAQADRDFDAMEAQLQSFYATYDFPLASRNEWRRLIADIKALEVDPPMDLPDEFWWPVSKEEVRARCNVVDDDDTNEPELQDTRARALAHARILEENRFVGMLCGPNIRFKSTDPSHATLGNIVVIRNDIEIPDHLLLGKYETLFSIGKVRICSVPSWSHGVVFCSPRSVQYNAGLGTPRTPIPTVDTNS
jgi:hypothetical protein